LYFVSTIVDRKRLACLASDDKGRTWREYAISDRAFGHRVYSIGAAREITDDGWIVGAFTDVVEGANTYYEPRSGKVYFFRIKARTEDPSNQQYRIETIAGNGKPGDVPEHAARGRDVPVDLPFGVEHGPDGALYVTTVGSHRVLRLDTANGAIASVAGKGRQGYAGDGGPATEATLNEPYEVRFDSQGNMLIVEMRNHLIRRVDAKSGTISTVAGDGVAGDRGDGGPARLARFRDPHSIALDNDDNLYISDLSNHRVRRVDAKSGRIETIAGNGTRGLPEDGGLAKEQPFLTPQGLAIRRNNLWIASVSGHSVWRLELDSGVIHRVAGTGRSGYSGDGGDPLQATFDGPRGIAMSPSGTLYVVEGENNVIRAIDTVAASIRTIAGAGPKRHLYDGDGVLALEAPLWQPHGICVSNDGSLVLSDTINHRVRRLLPARRVP
jgi:DNA-binding beta-propeller fold protein YncE